MSCRVANPQDTVTILVPTVFRDRLAKLRLHPRQPYYEILEEAVSFWLEKGGWWPYVPAPVDPHPGNLREPL